MFLKASLEAPRRAGRRRGAGREAGQALVELVVVLPVLLVILLGAVDFGRVLMLTIQLQNAAREGAAFGATKPTCTGSAQCADPGNVTYVARQELGGDAAATVTVSCSAACASSTSAAGNTITVRVARPFSFLTPFIGTAFGHLTPTAAATAVIQ